MLLARNVFCRFRSIPKGTESAQALSLLRFIGYKITRHTEANLKGRAQEVFYPSCGGLEGATNSSRSIPSAIRVAAARKVSIKDLKSCFLVLATRRAASFSSRASLQWTRARHRATSAPHRAEGNHIQAPNSSLNRYLKEPKVLRRQAC